MTLKRSSQTREIRDEIRKYRVVFVSLLFLTILVVTVSYLRFNRVVAVTILVSIAALKAGLVAGYFMHLISEKNTIYSLLILTSIILAAILIMPLFGSVNTM
jgi:cytochrome c oxidase subunit IV